MEENSDIFSKLIKRRKPTLPDNFFQNFQSDLLSHLSDQNDSDKISFSKTKNPDVPVDFFKNFHATLADEIESSGAFSDLNINKNKLPAVPSDFESEFRKNLMEKIRTKKSRGRILKISFWSTATAVAAGLTLLFTLNTEPAPETPILTEENVTVADEESLDTYVAYLDEESLVDYIIENDIDMGETEEDNEDVYDYVSSDIEDIYLDL